MRKKANSIAGCFAVAALVLVGAGFAYMLSVYVSDARPVYMSLMAAFVGLVGAFSVPLWQALVVNAPKLTVEISAIKRTVSPSAVISIDNHPELRPLKLLKRMEPPIYTNRPEALLRRAPKDEYEIEKLEELLIKARQELEELPNQIAEQKRTLETVNSIKKEKLTKNECERLNKPLLTDIPYDDEAPEKAWEEFVDAYEKLKIGMRTFDLVCRLQSKK